jgi:hypothetical protein
MYYRDGVSEGQFQQVKDLELPQLRAAIKNVCAYGAMEPSSHLVHHRPEAPPHPLFPP